MFFCQYLASSGTEKASYKFPGSWKMKAAAPLREIPDGPYLALHVIHTF